LAPVGNEIGTVLLFRRKSLCAKLNMLKSIPKPDTLRITPFSKVLFLCPEASGQKAIPAAGVAFSSL